MLQSRIKWIKPKKEDIIHLNLLLNTLDKRILELKQKKVKILEEYGIWQEYFYRKKREYNIGL